MSWARANAIATLALGNENVTLAIERDARAEVIRPDQFGLLPVDHAHIAQRVAAQRGLGSRGASALVVAGLGITEIDALAAREVRCQRDVEQATLALHPHTRYPG